MRRGLLCALAIAVLSVAAAQGARWNFIPDWTFKGNDLKKDWTVLGRATWQAINGELIGTPTAPEGGWLVLNDRCPADFWKYVHSTSVCVLRSARPKCSHVSTPGPIETVKSLVGRSALLKTFVSTPRFRIANRGVKPSGPR